MAPRRLHAPALPDPYRASPQNIAQHIAVVHAEGELGEAATCKSHFQVRQDDAGLADRTMAREIDEIIECVSRAVPDVSASQLHVTHPADDAGLWFLRRPGLSREVQLESSSGNCPFVVEADHDTWARHTARSIYEAVSLVIRLLSR